MSKHLNTPIIVLAGPTASGKSDLGLQIAKEIDAVVINADSKQVYKETPISTAQPIADRKLEDHWLIDGVPHYLYGNRSIYNPIDLYQYQQDVYRILTKTNNLPILLGGTGLYIDSVIKNFQLEKENNADMDLDGKDVSELQELAGELLDDLNESDRNNPQRLKRMIERGGKLGEDPVREYIYFQTEIEKEEIENPIKKRTRKMLRDGLEKEAKRFKSEIVNDVKQFKIIGLQEFKEYFQGKANLKQVEEQINTHTLQYVKKQKTWFKRVEGSINIRKADEALPYISNFLRSSTSVFSN